MVGYCLIYAVMDTFNNVWVMVNGYFVWILLIGQSFLWMKTIGESLHGWPKQLVFMVSHIICIPYILFYFICTTEAYIAILAKMMYWLLLCKVGVFGMQGGLQGSLLPRNVVGYTLRPFITSLWIFRCRPSLFRHEEAIENMEFYGAFKHRMCSLCPGSIYSLFIQSNVRICVTPLLFKQEMIG